MANDLNQCSFIGRLGSDVETRYLPNGDAVANVNIAVGQKWKDKNTGQPQERATWVRLVAFRRTAEVMAEYLHKGSQIHVICEYRSREFQDQSGQKRYAHEFIVQRMQMLDTRGDGTQRQQAPQQPPRQPPQQGYHQGGRQQPPHQGQYQGDYQQQPPPRQPPPQQPPPPDYPDFDDDIPF